LVAAEQHYGVVLDHDTLRIDAAATVTLRSQGGGEA